MVRTKNAQAPEPIRTDLTPSLAGLSTIVSGTKHHSPSVDRNPEYIHALWEPG